MRTSFHHQLDRLRADLGHMCALAGQAAREATCALLDTDVDRVRSVRTDVDALRVLHNAVERDAIALLATQAPVAGDLRRVVAAVRIAADADRMGGLAAHVAKLCQRREAAELPGELRDVFEAMGATAVRLADSCRTIVLTGDVEQARQIFEGDAAMEELHGRIFRIVTSPEWRYGAGPAADAVLLGRFFGRFADHAAAIAQRVIFQSTGGLDRDGVRGPIRVTPAV